MDTLRTLIRVSPPTAGSLERNRGHYDYIEHGGDMYNDPFTEARWVADPNGPTVLSTLVGSFDQAPMFDVDYAVTAAHTDTGSVLHVRVTRARDLRRLRRGLKTLVADGHVPADAVGQVRASIKAALRSGATIPVTVPVTVPVVVTRSKSMAHSHLWIETTMSFKDSLRFARALGFVDRKYIRICSARYLWQLNSPA